jgi:sugar fermentation stimulation protein A
MNFNHTLIEGNILKRYKRFFADVQTPNGEVLVAHVANTGSMKTCWAPGWPALLSDHRDSDRKLKYTLEMVHNGKSWIGVNTAWPNKLAQQAIEAGKLPEFKNYNIVIPEQKIGDSRIDLLLKSDDKKYPDQYVEIKNVTMLGDDGLAIFPDSVSERGQKHLRELTQIVESGGKAAMLFIIQRQDIKAFRAAAEIDPEYARLLKAARDAGVDIIAYRCDLGPKGIELVATVPISF